MWTSFQTKYFFKFGSRKIVMPYSLPQKTVSATMTTGWDLILSLQLLIFTLSNCALIHCLHLQYFLPNCFAVCLPCTYSFQSLFCNLNWRLLLWNCLPQFKHLYLWTPNLFPFLTTLFLSQKPHFFYMSYFRFITTCKLY